MAEPLKSLTPLERLGAHASGSLESARAGSDAAARVRMRLAAGEPPARAGRARGRLRFKPAAIAGAFAVAAAVAFLVLGVWRDHRALTFVVNGAASTSASGSERGVVGAFLAAPVAADLPLAFSDGTNVRIGAGGRARIAEVTPRGARVLVESGVVHANVVHRADTRWFVDAGPFEVKVTGTRFDVAWQPAEQAVVVTLEEGSVIVTGCGLADGQRIVAGQELHASCKLGTSSVSPVEGNAPAAAATNAATNANASTPATTNANALPAAPATAAPTANAPASTNATAPATANASTTAADPSAADLLSRATADRYAGNFTGAKTSLDSIRRRFPGTDAAATAAFELGRIAFDARRDFATAANWFDTYLRERPGGALAREALGRTIEARQRAGDDASARQAAVRYLDAYPDGPHATLARRLSGAPTRAPSDETP